MRDLVWKQKLTWLQDHVLKKNECTFPPTPPTTLVHHHDS